MLFYTVFCCLLLVQVKGQCFTKEVTTMILKLNEKQTCRGENFASSNFLPTKWTGCKWSCLHKGFEDIQKLSRTNSCTTIIQSIENRTGRIKRLCTPTICQTEYETAATIGKRSEAERCVHATTGNMTEFLNETIRYLQILNQ
ncbi:uncharacterized protein LOC144586818 [Pogona vitticeps]